MPTAYRIFLESREAFAAIGTNAGHLYLVLRRVDVDSNGVILSNSYNFVSDRTIGGTPRSSAKSSSPLSRLSWIALIGTTLE
jgi:hypothetical protein